MRFPLIFWQVVDVERLVKELGERDLVRTIQDVTKAELARVFAAIHLEQISSTHAGKNEKQKGAAAAAAAAARQAPPPATSSSTTAGGTTSASSFEEELPAGSVSRSKICDQVIQYTQPLVAAWGVRIC